MSRSEEILYYRTKQLYGYRHGGSPLDEIIRDIKRLVSSNSLCLSLENIIHSESLQPTIIVVLYTFIVAGVDAHSMLKHAHKTKNAEHVVRIMLDATFMERPYHNLAVLDDFVSKRRTYREVEYTRILDMMITNT